MEIFFYSFYKGKYLTWEQCNRTQTSKDLSWWRRLWSSSSEDILTKTSSRRLDQDQYIRLTHTSSEDVCKMSWSRPIYWSYVFKTSSRRLQDVFKTYYQVKLFLLNYSVLVFKMFLRLTAKTAIYSRICLGHTFEKFMVTPQNLQMW